jgi:hypothetical protein
MGYQKLQVGRITAMDDKKSDFSDTVNLNDPILDAAGSPKTYTITALSFAGTYSTLTASGATFISDGVQLGDVAYNTSTPLAGGRIVSVNSETEIVVEGLIASVPATQFTILKGSTEPAVLYVGTHAGAGGQQIKVRTSGGDDITFENIPEGSFLPVQVKRIWLTGTTVSDVLALF